MKKLISCLCVFALVLTLAPAAFAEWDLSGLSFDELVALKDQINLAIWNSAEWQEVTVPQGVYQVGADIPAGKWTIRPVSGKASIIKTGVSTKDGGASVKADYSENIYAPDSIMYKNGSRTELTIELSDGQYVEISVGSVIFTPYSGKPSLGFK